MGQSPPGETYNESREGTPFFQGRRDFGFRFPTNRVYCTAPTRFAARGDTLMSVRAPVGDVNMAIDRCSVGRGVAAARHKSTSISYTYYAFRSLRDRFEVYNGEGTVFGSISQKDLRAIPWLAPDDAVVSRFDQMAGPIDQRIELNEVQNRRLAGLRDTLLPKLMSGEIEIPEAEAIAEETCL
jgi:type I restriction enzyme S subunit